MFNVKISFAKSAVFDNMKNFTCKKIYFYCLFIIFLTEYYNKLVELGIIIPPKTQEQIQQEQIQMMSEMMAQIQKIKTEMEALKNDKSANNSKNAQH